MLKFSLFLVSAISAQIEASSRSLVTSLSSLGLPSEIAAAKSLPTNVKDKRSHNKAQMMSDHIDISVLLLMHIISSTKILRDTVSNKVHKLI